MTGVRVSSRCAQSLQIAANLNLRFEMPALTARAGHLLERVCKSRPVFYLLKKTFSFISSFSGTHFEKQSTCDDHGQR